MEEDQRQRDDLREQYAMAERRFNVVQGEVEELRTSLETADRAKKAAEGERAEAADRVNELTGQTQSLSSQKRKLEADLSAMQVRFEFEFFIS